MGNFNPNGAVWSPLLFAPLLKGKKVIVFRGNWLYTPFISHTKLYVP